MTSSELSLDELSALPSEELLGRIRNLIEDMRVRHELDSPPLLCKSISFLKISCVKIIISLQLRSKKFPRRKSAQAISRKSLRWRKRQHRLDQVVQIVDGHSHRRQMFSDINSITVGIGKG